MEGVFLIIKLKEMSWDNVIYEFNLLLVDL